MFKPGEIAIASVLAVRPGETAHLFHEGVKGEVIKDLRVTILPSTPEEREASGCRWPVKTSNGFIEETALYVAHPSVIATASGRDRNADALQERMAVREVRRKGEDLLATVERMDRVQKVLSKASFEFNGHWKNGLDIFKEVRTRLTKHAFFGRDAMTKADAEAILNAPDHLLETWVPIDLPLRFVGLRECSCCGEEDFALETNGQVVRIGGAPCEFPNGLPPNEWELNVPSGKLVVANDLRKLFPLPDGDRFDVNSNLGCRQTAQAYAANGMSHACIGNTCPDVFQCEDGSFKIANPPSTEVWDAARKAYVPIEPALVFDGKRLAGICTDLFWYSICDHDEFQRRCKRFKQKPSAFNVEVIDIQPGVYRFRHNDERPDGPAECIFTRFERVRAPDPVKDFLTQYETVEVNANAFVQAQVAAWPTLYGKVKGRFGKGTGFSWSSLTAEERLSSWQRVANHTLCTIGNGVEWHEKGFPKAKVNPTVPDVEPPSFRAQFNWYPFSRPYSGLFEDRLAPSFVKLAFRVLESVISFGTHVQDDAHSRNVIHVRDRMSLAVKRYRELMTQYPDLADPEYVAWLSQKGRAEAWVEKFDLGPAFMEKHREHARKQRWVPEDAYAIEFTASKLKEGYFAAHPKNGGCWAQKKDAQRYALHEWADNNQPAEHNCFWAPHATNTSAPTYFVARVVRAGEVSHMGETLVEVAFDYGTEWMQDPTRRKALTEIKEKAGIRVLTKKEYDNLLPEAKRFFKEAEAKFKRSTKAVHA